MISFPRKFGVLGILLFLSLGLQAQSVSVSLDYIGRIGFPVSPSGCSTTDTTGGSDCWGYVAPDGSEYALMGVRDGIAVIRIPELTVVDVIPGPTGGDCWWHRDIQTYGDYAYAVAEMTGTNQGMMIIDLTPLPDSVRFVGSYVNGSDIRSHNMHIDVNTGYAYVCKQNYSGFRMIDLSDPENPQEAGSVNTGEIHDVYARNDTVVVSEGYRGSFSIWDVSDKSAPQMLARIQVPSAGYAHNAWLSDDGKYIMTTEETTNKTVKMWHIEDMENISLAGEYLAENNLAHNTHIMGNLAVISHYAYGVVVVDISDPEQPVEVAAYDTYPQNNNPGFWGCWGAYPYSPNGYVFASDFNGYMTLLKLQQTPLGIPENTPPIAKAIQLAQNYPNPFNPETVISYQLSVVSEVDLSIYNSLGQKVNTLIRERQGTGAQRVVWDGRDDAGRAVPSGTYFYRLRISGEREIDISRKMVLMR